MTGLKMSKPIRLLAIYALAGAAIFAAAQLASAPPPSSMAATTAVSPLEMMLLNDETLPADFWDAS